MFYVNMFRLLCEMSNICCVELRLLTMLSFLGTMSVCKRTLFSVWLGEKDTLKKFSALEEFVFSNVIEKSKCTEEEHNLIVKELKNFSKRLSDKCRECHRGWQRLEHKYKAWLDEELVLVCQNTQKGAGRKQKEIAACHAKRQCTKVSELVEGNTCNELMIATRVSLYKAGKRSASQVVSMVGTDSDASKKLKEALN